MAECASIAPVAEAAASVPAKSAVPGDGMDFFGFQLEPEETYTAEKEVMDYLRSGGYELDSLKQFPNIKNIFLKYNTPTPSSAPVERCYEYDSTHIATSCNIFT